MSGVLSQLMSVGQLVYTTFRIPQHDTAVSLNVEGLVVSSNPLSVVIAVSPVLNPVLSLEGHTCPTTSLSQFELCLVKVKATNISSTKPQTWSEHVAFPMDSEGKPPALDDFGRHDPTPPHMPPMPMLIMILVDINPHQGRHRGGL